MRRLLSFPIVFCVLRSSASDACEIASPAPTSVIPTVPSQPFSFVATTDCTTLSFSAQRGDIVKTPRAGTMMGADRRRYTVSLTLAEWNTVASSDAATFGCCRMKLDLFGPEFALGLPPRRFFFVAIVLRMLGSQRRSRHAAAVS